VERGEVGGESRKSGERREEKNAQHNLFLSKPTQPTQQGAVSNFNLNFLNTLDKLKDSGLVNASYNFDNKFLTSYKLFTETRLLENEEQGKEISKNVTTQTSTKTSQTTDKSTDTSSKITKSEFDSVYNLVNGKKEEDQKNNPDVIKLLNDIETNVPKDKLSNIKVEYDGKDITLGDAIQKLKNETVKESRYIILENAYVPGGFPQPPGASGGGGATPSTPQSVKDIWDLYEFDATPGITRLTQREVDEINSLLTKGTQNLRYEPEKRPDPIVSIARIFGEAHQLYFTEVIPSGRPNGRVSQKTFREYYPLGKERSSWKDGEAPVGPFAVKSVFNKWKTGVEKLLMNQEYRKILANVRFVVPGAEDKFNDNFNTKVFEADEPTVGGTPVTKQSDGQILFQFINDMLDKNKIDDFDTLRSTLMSKYFGIKMSDKDKQAKSQQPQRPPTKDEIEANVTYFSSLQNPKIDVSKSKFYAIPIKKFVGKNGKPHDLIFLQVIKKETVNTNEDAILVRFTYDDPIIMTNYHKKTLPNTKYVDWSQYTAATTTLYYGLMKASETDIKNGKKFTLVYGNVNKTPVTQVYTLEFTVLEGRRSLASNQEIEVKPSKLVTNDNTSFKDITLSSGFEGKMMANDGATHNDNLNKNVQSVNKKLIDVLKEEFKKIP
jgi:hypothetical protein